MEQLQLQSSELCHGEVETVRRESLFFNKTWLFFCLNSFLFILFKLFSNYEFCMILVYNESHHHHNIHPS